MTKAKEPIAVTKRLSEMLEPSGGTVSYKPSEKQKLLKSCADAQWMLSTLIADLVL